MAQNIDRYSEVQTYLDVLCQTFICLAAPVGVAEKHNLVLQGELQTDLTAVAHGL